MAIFKFLAFYLLVLIQILAYFSNPTNAAFVPKDGGRNQIRGPKLRAADTSNKKMVKNVNRVDPNRGCGEMSSRSECGQYPKCRWCKSDALDDMCFSKSEAWRLPSQVFSCEF